MSILLPKPKSITESEVVVSRADWDRLTETLRNLELEDDAAEDADDIAEIARIRAADAGFAARVERERGASVEVTIPIEVVEAELDGVHPIAAWRDYRGWTQLSLSSKSRVSRELIAKIETGRKQGSIKTLDRLARALQVPIEVLLQDGEDSDDAALGNEYDGGEK